MTEGDEQRIAAVVASLPVGDKATITAGRSLWETAEIPPIGLRSMLLSDGPLGVRGPDFDGRNTSLCLPSTSALAATWDPALAERIGQVIAGEAIRLGVHVVLGPMVNLHRTPLGGRVFESFSEDPLLTGRLARSWVLGVQGRGVGTTAKHFIANDAEQGRLKADCHVSERALRELYLVPFEMLVEAGVWAVMVAYNGLDGTPLTRHQDLLRRVLKDEWGFDGVVMSDWYAQSDTVVSANAGLDLEMPGPGRAFGPELAEAVSSGRCREAVLDDMAARMLRLAVRAGCLQTGDTDGGPLGGGSPRDVGGEDEAAVLLDAAVGGMTLLRNNGILPLAPAAARIAVIGPAAVDPAYMGGGSAQVLMEPAPTPAEAIMQRFGRQPRVVVEPGCASRLQAVPLERSGALPAGEGQQPGLTLEYLTTDSGGEHVVAREVRETSSLMWVQGLAAEAADASRLRATKVRLIARLVPPRTGRWEIAASGTGPISVVVDDGTPVLVEPFDPLNYAALVCSPPVCVAAAALVAGTAARLVFEMEIEPSSAAILRVGCVPPEDPAALDRAVAAAAEADVAIVVVGTTEQDEREGADRTTTALPGRQAELVRRVVAASPGTVVVVNAGGAVDLSCAAGAAAVLYSWFGGQRMSEAIAAVLSGDREPGGRLPFTIARSEADYPVLVIAAENEHRIDYAEGVFIGYRHFDQLGIEPEFCFGHGIGYTTFELADLTLSAASVSSDSAVIAQVRVRNTGTRTGKAVVQLYVSPPDAGIARPPRELKAFEALTLEPDEDRLVSMRLDPRAFAHWDELRHAWATVPGTYQVEAGRSSRDICLRSDLTIEPGDA